MHNILVLKDIYNSFEAYYLNRINKLVKHCGFYYKNSNIVRKFITHFGLPLESLWYADWKNNIDDYDWVIVFDSLHTSKLVKYLHNHSSSRIIYWHWNPIKTKNEKKIIEETKGYCEHWTFNPIDAQKYSMRLNNQFFFYQTDIPKNKEERAFFVGVDKGRYQSLVSLATQLEDYCIIPDFHVINKGKMGRFYQKNYMDYDQVLDHLKTSRFAVEIVQEGQNGLTARAIEAMFFKTKLITNNQSIKECTFYNKQNVYVIGDAGIEEFLQSPFTEIENRKLYPYSAQGWIEKFMER